MPTPVIARRSRSDPERDLFGDVADWIATASPRNDAGETEVLKRMTCHPSPAPRGATDRLHRSHTRRHANIGRSNPRVPSPCREGFGLGVVQEAPPRSIRHHPHLLPPPRKGEERRSGMPAQSGDIAALALRLGTAPARADSSSARARVASTVDSDRPSPRRPWRPCRHRMPRSGPPAPGSRISALARSATSRIRDPRA